MTYQAVTVPAVGDATKVSLVQQLADNEAYLLASTELSAFSGNPINPSFDALDGNGDPVGWTITTSGTGAYSMDDSTVDSAADVIHGQRALRCTITNGGVGSVTVTSDLFQLAGPMSSTGEYVFYVAAKMNLTSASTVWMRLQATVKYYDAYGNLLETDSNVLSVSTIDTNWRTFKFTSGCGVVAKYAIIAYTVDVSDGSTPANGYVLLDFPWPMWFVAPAQATTIPSAQSNFTTLASVKVVVPSDATVITVKSKINRSTSGTIHFRAILPNSTGSDESTTSATPTEKTSTITVAAADQGKVLDLSYQYYISLISPSDGTATIESVVTAGYEAKITIY